MCTLSVNISYIINVQYHVLVEMVCSIHVFALYEDIEFVIITIQPYIYTCF